MFDLTIRFKTLTYFLLFLILAFADILWVYRNLKNKSHLNLVPFIWANALFFVAWGRIVGIDIDESEHLHCAWMVSQGLIPFKDFWQHHSPLLWIILAPFFKIFKPSVLIFEWSRILSAMIFTAISFMGWQITKKIWREKSQLSTYLFILFSASIYAEFLWLRPDLFLYLFLLFGVYFSLEISASRLLPAFLAGVSFGLAEGFVPKQYLLLLLPAILIFLENNKLRIVKLLTYVLGLLVGSLPLLFYLINKNILGDFIFWVFKFNQQRLVQERLAGVMIFPVAIGFMGIWGGYLLLRRYRKFKDKSSLVVLTAFCLSTLCAVNGTPARYYLGFWYILCAMLGSGCNVFDIAKNTFSLTKKSIVLGLFFTLFIAPNYINFSSYRKTYFNEDKRVISKLMEYCGRDTCFAILQLHPIFNYDATRLYSNFQYGWLNIFSSVKKDAKSKNITMAILNSKPAVISYSFNGKVILFDLFLNELISKEDFNRLRSFLKENYTVTRIGETKYYIRNDKL